MSDYIIIMNCGATEPRFTSAYKNHILLEYMITNSIAK